MKRLASFVISITGAAIVAAALTVPSQVKRTDTKPRDGCAPIAEFVAGLARVPELRNFRPVQKDKVAEAIELFNLMPPLSRDQWDAAYLIDGPSRSGGLLVGKNNRLCGLVVFQGRQWDALISTLEPKS